MQIPTVAESGFGFLARLSSKPSFLNLDTTLFPNGLLAEETVEIRGDISSGKTLLITQLIAKALLPCSVEGSGIKVLLINTEHHFMISKLFTLMINALKSNWSKSDNEADQIARESLKSLNIINCYDYPQFTLCLNSLDIMLLNDDAVSLLVIDSFSTFYWCHREIHGICMQDKYIANLLKIIQRQIFQTKVSLIYTKVGEDLRDIINCVSKPTAEAINYRVTLNNCSKRRLCVLETASDKERFEYVIDDNGLRWIPTNQI